MPASPNSKVIRRGSGRRPMRVVALLGVALVGAATPWGLAGGASSTNDWWGYHGGAQGAGVASGVTGVNTSSPRWTSPELDGQVYGEPLVYQREVIVATENDSVYALSANDGHILWRQHVATAVPSRTLPCGDIAPEVGITGTPVIDPLRHEVFALAFELRSDRPVHYLYGLDVRTGARMLQEPLSTPTSDQRPYLNRSGLALSHGAVIYTFGGNFGDCGTYHGVVGAVSETSSGPATTFVVDSRPGQREGAIWMGGAAPAIDSAGNVWVSSGNGSVTSSGQPYDHSDAVLELSPTMKLRSFFAPSNWTDDNAADADLASEPALMGQDLAVVTGKSGRIYLVRVSHLGGIGGQLSTIDSHCGNVLVGGVAIVGSVVYLPCWGGTEAVHVSSNAPRLTVLWRAPAGSGPPIVAGHRVWTIGIDGHLYGLSLRTGAVMQRVALSGEANHFATPSVGAGLLLAPLARGVVAFAAP